MFIALHPDLFKRDPWKSLTPAQQSNFVYTMDHSTAGSTQNILYPRPARGGQVNGMPKMYSVPNQRSLSVTLIGDYYDAYMFKQVYFSSDSSSWAGSLVAHIADAMTQNIVIVRNDAGTALSVDDFLNQRF